MGKRMFLGLIFACVLLLCACTDINLEVTNTTLPTHEPTTTQTATEDVTTTTLPVPETTGKETEPTAPAHSELYLPEYTAQQILEYFEEVVLHVEYANGTGNTALVQKWKEPILYRIYGNATQEDLAVLEDLFVQLNAVPGFPGIHAAGEDEVADLTLGFMTPEELRSAFSSILNGEEAYGATQFWYYTATNEIYMADIGYRTDIDQLTRNSILIEEVINTLGITDTVLRTDSIVYQYSDENLTLSDIDWVILKLLYDPGIQCGMDYDSCSEIIQQLYY